ncbi:hypothetical protein B0J11DRAFT_507009 [Dendryphion nanum]|uniref:F-box domain-containing protein n=1 Tax=Dendryphion nanum TaxID=256645 RepID=A0A9P9DRI5_9PLEO|nr:hypothetical protein B0J11DRAFT_507009 [Dendryphion nanum]
MDTAPRVLTILPCAYAPESCTTHAFGRNNPFARRTLHQTPLLRRLALTYLSLFAPQCHLLNLPVELILEISTHLSPCHRIALAWTCKALYSTIQTSPFASLEETNRYDFAALLLALQKDRPRHRVCLPCRALHPPSQSTISRPTKRLHHSSSSPNPLHRNPNLKVYLLAPETGCMDGKRPLLYTLTTEHITLTTTSPPPLCIYSLHCTGTFTIRSPLPLQALHNTKFFWKITPVLTRRNLIFHAVYEIAFAASPAGHWSEQHTRHLLEQFDIRCCVHCSTSAFVSEMICLLYHGERWRRGCVRCEWGDGVRAAPRRFTGEACGRHEHGIEGACGCVTEFGVEALHRDAHGPVGVRVKIWQWVGDKGDDVVLGMKGMVMLAYEDALMEERERRAKKEGRVGSPVVFEM